MQQTQHRQKRPALSLDSSLVQDNEPIEIVPKLYIGSIHAAFNQESLLSLGITHILNASRLPSTFPKQFTYLSIDVRDKESSNVLSCIPASNIFIEAGIEAGGVLVHCFGGRSRSAAFTIAFLMSSCGWSYDYIMQIIKNVRPVVSVNAGFEAQLRAYSQTNFDVYAAQQVLLHNRLSVLRRCRLLEASTSSTSSSPSSSSSPPSIIDRIENELGDKRSWDDVKETLMNEDDDDDGDDDHSHIRYKSNHINSSSIRGVSNSYRPIVITGESIVKNIPEMDPKTPNCRLSRPGSQSVRVIPPLRGLDRAYCCSSCGAGLFCLANVIRIDIDSVNILLDNSLRAEDKGCGEYRHGYSPYRIAASDYMCADNIDEINSSNCSTSGSDHLSMSGRHSTTFTTMGPPISPSNKPIIMNSRGGSCYNGISNSVQVDYISSVAAPKTSRANAPGYKAFEFDIPIVSNSNDNASHKSNNSVVSSMAFDNSVAPTSHSVSAKAIPTASNSGICTANRPTRLDLPLGRAMEDVWPKHQRPQSAEKRRWLARVSLLQGKQSSSADRKVYQLADDDDDASLQAIGKDKYMYMEYIHWMGSDIFRCNIDVGDIKCHSCKHVIGFYSWKPTEKESLNGRLLTPIIRIEKCDVYQSDLPFDATPTPTPRRDSDV